MRASFAKDCSLRSTTKRSDYSSLKAILAKGRSTRHMRCSSLVQVRLIDTRWHLYVSNLTGLPKLRKCCLIRRKLACWAWWTRKSNLNGFQTAQLACSFSVRFVSCNRSIAMPGKSTMRPSNRIRCFGVPMNACAHWPTKTKKYRRRSISGKITPQFSN